MSSSSSVKAVGNGSILPKINEGSTLNNGIPAQAKDMDPQPIETFFSTTKNFWRTRTNVEFKIIRYKLFDCIEIICYNLVRINPKIIDIAWLGEIS